MVGQIEAFVRIAVEAGTIAVEPAVILEVVLRVLAVAVVAVVVVVVAAAAAVVVVVVVVVVFVEKLLEQAAVFEIVAVVWLEPIPPLVAAWELE